MPKYFLFATKNGKVKKTEAEEYANIRTTGIIAINLEEDDQLLSVEPTNGNARVLLITAYGKSILFHEEDVRATGRATQGVKGIDLKDDDYVIGMEVITEQEANEKDTDAYEVLVISENGYGKRSKLEEYSVQGRGGQGVYTAKLGNKTGNLVGMKLLRNGEDEEGEDLLVISRQGQAIRLPIEDVPTLGRYTQGVRIIRLNKNDQVSALAIL